MLSAKDTTSLRPVLTVSELTAQVRVLLEDIFDQVAVVGEISNAKVHSSGHWYFSLKDKEATLPCVCWRNSNANIKFELQDGLMVVARGKLTVYPPRGAYQMVAYTLEPVGIGQWQLAFEQLKERLESEGLLSPERKRAIPLLPRKIGVVTSPTGAALKDILTALKRRNRNVSVVISPARVQGEGSVEEIVEAIENLNQLDDIDVMVVARGGGSIEDLWAFNSEAVARAVVASRIPVVSGIGHETDLTICDLVADLRAPTPTAAAELVAKGRIELLDRWANLNRRMLSSMEQRIFNARRQLERLNPIHALRRYQERLKAIRLRLSNYQELMLLKVSALLNQARHRWHNLQEKLLVLGPINVLSRGFAILRNKEGKVVTQASNVKVGEELEALLHHGKIILRVESKEGEWY